MRVIVTGSRKANNPFFVFDALSKIHEKTLITTLVHGMAKGVDTYAAYWASSRGITVEGHKAEWNKYKSIAGILRNKKMAELGADLCIVFPGGNGTTNMKKEAMKKGIPIKEIKAY